MDGTLGQTLPRTRHSTLVTAFNQSLWVCEQYRLHVINYSRSPLLYSSTIYGSTLMEFSILSELYSMTVSICMYIHAILQWLAILL